MPAWSLPRPGFLLLALTVIFLGAVALAVLKKYPALVLLGGWSHPLHPRLFHYADLFTTAVGGGLLALWALIVLYEWLRAKTRLTR